MDLSDQGGMPRARIRGEQRVTPLELFLDLVFVFAGGMFVPETVNGGRIATDD